MFHCLVVVKQCSVRLYNNTLVVFSTEYCTYSQQYCVIWKCQSYAVLTNHRGMYQTPKGYTCTVCDISHIHTHFSLWTMASLGYKYVHMYVCVWVHVCVCACVCVCVCMYILYVPNTKSREPFFGWFCWHSLVLRNSSRTLLNILRVAVNNWKREIQ